MVWIIETDLEKCPFCGGEAELKFSQHAFGGESYTARVECKECGASTAQALSGKMMFGKYVTLDEAIIKARDRWNKREISRIGKAVSA